MPEGLETGEFKVSGTAEFDELETVNVVAYSGDNIPLPIGTGAVVIPINQGGYTLNGMAQSVVFIICTNEWYIPLMNSLQQETYSDYIISCFSVPKLAVQDFMNDTNRLETFQGDVFVLQNPNPNLNSNKHMHFIVF